jgi:hypothetical protein
MVAVYAPPRAPVSTLRRSLVLLVALGLLVATLPVDVPLPQPAADSLAGMPPQFDALPLHFVPNVGQTDAAMLMETRSPQGTVSFATHEVAFTLPDASEAVRQPVP